MVTRSPPRSRALTVALTTALLVGAGCIGQGRFTEDLCTAGGSLDLLGDIDPVIELDYLALRLDGAVFDEIGEPCVTAPDPVACAAALDALPLESEFRAPNSQESSFYTLVFTRGAMVGAFETTAELKDFLGEIDTPAEAGLFALLNGHQIACNERDEAGFDDGGFVVYTKSGDGCSTASKRHVLLVRSNGRFEILKSVTKSLASPGCST
ncbi:MAG: hypothetical protein KC486_07785 [Myxococcales bacterium]|nr:hypothetical protein [Myxococcales bacterium]